MLGDLTEWVTDVIDALGYLGVAFLVALESVFPPIPSEVVLPLAGFVAGRGDASLPGMILAATIGSVVGAWVLYGLSAWIGPIRLRRFVLRYGKWFGVKERDLDRAEAWFDKRATAAVLLGRCVPLVRSIVSVPAGFRRMNLGTFVLYTVIGSAVWNTALVTAGYLLREQWHDVEPVLDTVQYIVVAAIIVAIGWFVWSRRRNPDAVPTKR